MADDCDEDVIFENSALYKHLVDAGVPDIPVESTGKKSDELSQNEKESMDDLSQPKDTLQNILQFLKAVDRKLKIHLSVDLLFTKLHSYQNNLLLQKIIQNKALEDDDKIFLENYISETKESADLNKGKELLLCCVVPLFGIILLYMWCLFSPLSAMILMNPTFSIIRLLIKFYMLIMVGLVALLVWHVLLLKHRGRQVLDFLQQAEASIALQKKSLRLIQEVELVRKGFTLVSSQISVSKAENSSPVNQRLCPELRHIVFLTSRSNMLSCRRTTRLLLEHYPLIDEVDKASTYLAQIPLEDYGPSLQQVEDDDKSKENLSKLTDDFSVTALKAMLYLYGMQQSELVRRLALCFCVNAQPETQRGKLDSSICPLVVDLNKQLIIDSMKLGNSYEFHRSSFQERDVKSSPPNQKQAMSSVSELYMAVHSLDLHLRAALHRSFALSTELEKFSEDEIQEKGELNSEDKETDEEIQENLSKKEKLWYDQLESVKAELEACRGCWEVGLDKINRIYKKKQAQVPKLSPTSEGEPEKKTQVISADDIDPVIVDEVFEDYTDPDKDEFECNYVRLSPEEREKREQDQEESRRMMFELRNVIAVRATDMERREEVAIKRSQMQKDDTLCASSHSSTDAEQSDDSLHTDSLQSDSLQSDLPNKDDDSMQQSGNLNEDLIDEDPLASDDEFSPSKLKDLNHSEETSVNQISWSKSLSLSPEGEQQETTPFFLHEVAGPVETDHFSDLHLRNLLFSPTAETADTESMKTDSLHENSKADHLDSLDGSDNLSPLKNGGTDLENNSSHPLSKQKEFKLSSDGGAQFPSDQSFSFVLHAGAENSSRGSSRSPSLTPTHRISNTNSNHINNNANLGTPPTPPLNTDSTSSTQGSGFFLHSKADDDGDSSGGSGSGGEPLPKRSLKGTNLVDLQERWAADSGGPGLSLTRNIAALASARCKEQINLNIQTFGDEEETFGDDSFDEDDSKLSDDDKEAGTMSEIKDSPELDQPVEESVQAEIAENAENAEKKLKRSNTQIAPAHSNSTPSNSRSRRGSLKQNKQFSIDGSRSLSLKESRSMDSGDAIESPVYEDEEDDQTTNENNKAGAVVPQKQRSRSSTVPNIVSLKSITKLFPSFNLDRLRMAREITEKAIKMNRIFTIQGGYATVRNCLRKRGWVENFFRATEVVKKPPPKSKSDVYNSDDDDDDDDVGIDTEVDVPKVKPWEEEGGLYGIMSRMVRNLPPALFWVLRRDLVDYRTLNKTQMVNHFVRSAVFTTKVGLCVNLRNLQWFDETDPDTFFPRCYRLSHEEEKHEFIDDFNFTACMNILKIVVENYMSWPTENQGDRFSPKSNTESGKIATEKSTDGRSTPKKLPHVPALAVRQALKQCEMFISSKENMDVDMDEQQIKLECLSDSQWEKLREWYYQLVHNNSTIIGLPATLVNQCEASLKRLQILCPQFYLDGKNSVWIVKPGAKSRGRGITCYDRLEEILKLVDSNVAKRESKYVIQKYIERPLLIYNCKFDIRQWFLITDWNPLTMWFYRDSYLRFCSQQFTLTKFDESIHLCNNAVQKNYKNGPRAKELPENNMWTHHQFQEYLRNRSLPNTWEDVVYPGMKKAIICSMFVSQELVEPRKGSFELYGADFMLTDDYSPWLIEINSSPSMEASTEVTSRLCTRVLEDTIKVVLDRKNDKNCDIGQFEMGYRQATVNSPPYLCMNMSIEGQGIKKPCVAKRPVDPPPDTKENVLPATSQQPKKTNGQIGLSNPEKQNTTVDCKEVLRENTKVVIPSSNAFTRKKAGVSVVNKKLVKSQTSLEACSTYTIPNKSLRTHRERFWTNKALEINSTGFNSTNWLLDREEVAKKNKKIDHKVLKGNTIIRYPNVTGYSVKNFQIPSIETRKLKADIKSFRDRPKKTLATPIARIKFPLLTLQITKPHLFRITPQKQI